MLKKIILILVCVTFIVSASFSQTSLVDKNSVSNGLNIFSVDLLDVVPNVAVQQGVWADAWIGKLIPSVPPHLGGGLTVGIAQLDSEGLNVAIGELNTTINQLQLGPAIPEVSDKLFLPTITADLRIGGLFLPFDLGISVMKIPTVNLKMLGSGLSLDFFTVGGSLRVPLVQGNVILPKIALGAGFMYSKGSVNVEAKDEFAYVNTDFDSKTLFLEAQISKTILFVTPFVGFRGILSESTSSWAWKLAAGLPVEETDSGTVSKSFKDDFMDNLQYQIYFGASLNVFIIHTTVSASYDFKNSIWGGNLSLRVNL